MLTSEELDKQVAEFLAKGGSIQPITENKYPKRKRTLCSFQQGEYDQVIAFIKLSPCACNVYGHCFVLGLSKI